MEEQKVTRLLNGLSTRLPLIVMIAALVFTAALAVASIIPDTSFAAGSIIDPAKESGLDTSKSLSNINNVVKTIVQVLAGIVGLVAIAVLVWKGISLAMSGGSPQKRADATSGILWGIIGLGIALGAGLFANWIAGTVQHLFQ